jgi:hypothetical protein
MAVDLGQGVAAAIAAEMLALLGQDAAIGPGVIALQPGGQRRSEIKAQAAEVAKRGVRRIALGGDLLVEIVIRLRLGSRGTLPLNGPSRGG